MMDGGYSFDFNHGGARPAVDPRGRDVSERVNDFIDAAFFAKRAGEARREYVGASAIGNDCLRAVQFGYVGVPIDDGRITGKTLRIFQAGHVFEDEVARWLQNAGFKLDVVDAETGKQFGFSVLGGKGSGHGDGILRDGPVPLEYPCLWEMKTMNEKSWQDCVKRGVTLSKPIYAAQIAQYQAHFNLPAPALFTAFNKNTQELYHELVPFDAALAQQMANRMELVIQATEQEQLLPRGYNSPDNFKCKWCDHHKTCWSLPR